MGYTDVFQCCLSKIISPPSGLRKVMVRAHRQAWCWQDEWYGLTIEDIRQLELETQLALAQKMAHFSQAEEATEANGAASSPDKNQEAKDTISSLETEEVVSAVGGGDTLQTKRAGLTKQWSTSSRSSRSSKRGGETFEPNCLYPCGDIELYNKQVVYRHHVLLSMYLGAVSKLPLSLLYPDFVYLPVQYTV